MDQNLTNLHALCLKTANSDFKQRLQSLAEHFLGVNYGPWQNGSNFESLDDLKYDFNTLDCVTYAEVVLALLNIKPSPDYSIFVKDFESMLRQIHYAQGIPNFLNSNHFFCIDWIPNNKNFVQDITNSIWPQTYLAETQIDKISWFARHFLNGGNKNLPSQVQKHLSIQPSVVPYIRTEDLLDNYSQFVKVMPEFSIITIVRPNWDVRERIGTHLNISHLGFALKNIKQETLDFYHATIIKMQVIQQSLYEYMLEHKDSPTIRGINVLSINPEFSHARK